MVDRCASESAGSLLPARWPVPEAEEWTVSTPTRTRTSPAAPLAPGKSLEDVRRGGCRKKNFPLSVNSAAMVWWKQKWTELALVLETPARLACSF